MPRRRWRRVARLAVGALTALVALGALAALAHARPGGGQSFSGGGGGGGYSGGGGGGGGSGDGGQAIAAIFELLFHYPQIGVPVLIIVIAFYIMKARAESRSSSSWDYGQFSAAPAPAAAPAGPTRTLAQLRDDDADFSIVLFEDFIYALYARAHRARHDATALAELTPYLSDSARTELARRASAGYKVGAALIGSMTVVRVRRTTSPNSDVPAGDWVRFAFESNLILESSDGKKATQYVREQWVLRRDLGVRTKPWKGARTFDCPNCGAPAAQWTAGKCGHCDQPLEGGHFDWMVHMVELQAIEDRPPSLTGTTAEVGTDSPTVFAPDAQQQWTSLVLDDPALTVEALGARLGLIYAQLNAGWNAQDQKLIRPWVSDGLHAYMCYWLEAYAAQGLKNFLAEARFTNWVIAKLTRDAHYTAVTVRVYATGLDYTARAHDGHVVGGSKTRPRAYSEYWTLIRGAAVRGAPRADRGCPNCGAELKAGMGGNCEYCGVVVTRGDFDWVLSKIEQDESYRG